MMRDATAIRLEGLIVHLIDPRRGGPLLSERAVPLAANAALADYVAAHIGNALRDPAARAARFLPTTGQDKDATACLCASLLDGTADLVAGSRRLAERLYAIVARDRRISPGDLAVCFYRAEAEGSGGVRHLGLIKIDPSEAFRHAVRRDADGRAYVSFELEGDVLPSTRERLQKCAFLRPPAPDPDGDYDMILLDRQVAPAPDQPVARFFVADFLGAELAFDARERTGRLYKALAAAHNALRPRLDPAEDEALQRARETLLDATRVDVDAWVGALPLPDAYREEVRAAVARRLPDVAFELDRTYAERLTRKRRFRGDDELRVEASAEMWDRDIRVERKAPPGEPPYTLVTIRTETWVEVPR